MRYSGSVEANIDYTPAIKLIYPPAMTYAEVTTALNRFYDVPENGPITVNGALKLIAQKSVRCG